MKRIFIFIGKMLWNTICLLLFIIGSLFYKVFSWAFVLLALSSFVIYLGEYQLGDIVKWFIPQGLLEVLLKYTLYAFIGYAFCFLAIMFNRNKFKLNQIS